MVRSDVIATRVTRNFLILAACSAAILGGKVAGAQNQKGITVTGSIIQSWTDPTGHRHETGHSGPLATRLCSVDRVLETQPDNSGAITFLNVPPGIYELSAGRQLDPPRTIRGIEVTAEEVRPAPLRWVSKTLLSAHENRRCRLLSRFDRALCFDFVHDRIRQPAAQRAAFISGLVAKRTHGGTRLGKAKISLTKAGDPSVRYSAVSDKNGLLNSPPQPQFTI